MLFRWCHNFPGKFLFPFKAFIFSALIGFGGETLWAADHTVTTPATLLNGFNSASPGDTLTLSVGVEIDLNQNGVESTLGNLTLQGISNYNFQTQIQTIAQSIITQAKNDDFSDGIITSLQETILANLPQNRIYNSNPKAYGSGLVLSGAAISATDERLQLGSSTTTAGATAASGNDTAWATLISGSSATVTIQKLALYNGSVANSTATGVTTGAASADVSVTSSRTVTATYDTDALVNGNESGISVSGTGFLLKNLNFQGTTGTVSAATTGATSVYLGLIGTNLKRDVAISTATEWAGIENSSFIDNVIVTEGAVHTVGNILFFSNRHYAGTGYQSVPGGRGGNGEAGLVSYYDKIDHITGSVFIGNKLINDSDASVGLRTWGAAGPAWVKLKTISGSYFADNFNQGHHAFGGALYFGSIVNIENSIFYNNVVHSDHESQGGAIFADSSNVTATSYSNTGYSIDQISNTVFVGNSAHGLYSLSNDGADTAIGAEGGAIRAASGIGTIT
ncbi:MAG: hypothetical protein LBF22_07955, partial [Deltaproteobacteria bacterium]|nr:hypothetical protein [Deltaproteobacteria bacterium]